MRAEQCAFFKYTIQFTGINSHFDTFVTPPEAAIVPTRLDVADSDCVKEQRCSDIPNVKCVTL